MSGGDSTMTEPKLMPAGLMILKPHDKERIAETVSLGHNELWSSENLRRHLWLLKTTFNAIPGRKVC